MRRITIFSIFASIALFAFSGTFQNADAQSKFLSKFTKSGKKQLQQANDSLRKEIDSLRMELEAYRNAADQQDSTFENVGEGDYGNTGFISAGLNPEEYTAEASDSLMGIWYHHRQVANIGTDEKYYNLDSVTLTSKVSDKVILERLENINSYITLPYNEKVRNYIILYSEKMPTKMGHMLALSEYYFPIFEETFNRYGIPEELKYMAVIESALNPTAVSRAGAKGMWQFMYSTARHYGLKINSYVDERMDPVKAADAAARYLSDAYKIFGDWNLAISSYNCGSGNVLKAIRRSGSNKDFWKIYEFLPRETRGYVPAFVGAMYAFTYYKELGITPEPVSMPAHVDTFHISKLLHFQQISELDSIPMQTLRDMNPQYVHDIVPGKGTEYTLRIPYQYSGAFIEHEDSMYTYKVKELFTPSTLQNIAESGTNSGSIVYRVKSGDYLGRIAARYHVTVNQLKKWNGLKSNNLRIGQKLVIYGNGGPAASKSTSNATSKTASQASAATATSGKTTSASTKTTTATAQTATTGEYVTYKVKAGDTLYQIAKAYPGVSANDIMKYNGIGTNIKPGMTIKIPKK